MPNWGCAGLIRQFISFGTIALGTKCPTEDREASHASPYACVRATFVRHSAGRTGAAAIDASGTSISHRLNGSMLFDRWMCTRPSAIASEVFWET